MFGLNQYEKQLKELLASCGCEASVFKNFKTACEKTNKKLPQERARYEECKVAVRQIDKVTTELEQYFADGKRIDLSLCMKELKKLQNSYVHEFLVSAKDAEFKSTYDTLVKNIKDIESGKMDKLFMQSETENLSSMVKEVIEREDPNLYAYTYFLLGHTDQELYDMNAQNKREYIIRIYQDEMLAPILDKVGESNQQVFALLKEMTGGNV